ncbi:glycosyltransferase family 4 protein [Solimonas soli]|uniref:glycosyltransferase family 4 protein n=1 Tax=Solimonas soli TaxID=413479 RepID=UPI000685D417|nr:glycosyltransferase family 4 protein [Solimonas soli]
MSIPEHDNSAVRKPRLLVLASTYPRWPNDAEPGFVHELAKRLTMQFDVLVLCPHAPGALKSEHMDGVEVLRYRYAPCHLETLVNDGGIVTNLKRAKWKFLLVPGFVFAQAWQAWRLTRARGIDVIHAHWLLPQGLIAAIVRTPFVVTSHGADLYALSGKFLDTLKRFVLRRAVAATVVSSAMSDALRGIGVQMDKVSVLSMGVDVEGRFTVGGGQSRSSDEILFVGRLVEKKGLSYLLRALPIVLHEKPFAHLTIAGFGPEEEQLKSLAESLGISERVHFLGALPQADLPALYRRAAVFVAPFVRASSGDQEGLPVALMEAIACGCPVLVGDVAGLSDLLGEHRREVLFDPRDTRALAKRLVDMLSNPKTHRTRALAMRDDVRKRFNWDQIAQAYASLLLAASSRR